MFNHCVLSVGVIQIPFEYPVVDMQTDRNTANDRDGGIRRLI